MEYISRIVLPLFIISVKIYTCIGEDDVPGSVCDDTKDGLESTGLKSKYFYSSVEQSYDQMKGFCSQRNLKVAEVTSEVDVDHLYEYIGELPPGKKTFMLDYMQDESGKFKDSTGMAMTFQNFEPGADLKFNSAKRCVVLRLMLMEPPQMVKVSCSEPHYTLCQYNHGDDCLMFSAQESIRQEDEMKSIGMIEEAEFFVSTMKKTQHEAAEICSAADKSLLVIKSQIVNEKVFAMAREVAASLQIDPRTEFWTNGVVKNGHLEWQYGEIVKYWEEISDSVHYMFGDDSAVNDPKKTCITYSADPPTPIDGKIVASFINEPCDVPQYFICYSGVQPEDAMDSKDKEDKLNATTTTEPTQKDETMPVSPTKLPPFFNGRKLPAPQIEEPFNPGGELPQIEEPFTKRKMSCYKITELPKITVDPQNPMPTDELLNIIKFARKNHIEETGIDIPFKADAAWRKELVTILSKLFSKVCPGALIPIEYVNTITVLASVYLNSLKPEHTATKVGQQLWDELIEPLKQCEATTKPISLSARGSFAHEWVMPDENRVNRILVPREMVDRVIPLNTVVDHFWSMYSLSMGNCMAMAESPTDWASKYFYNFNKDYIVPLMDAWTMPLNFDIGVLIGDFDLETMNYNMRACTTAAYMRSGIADRQLTRPMDMLGKNDMNSVNEKTGEPVINSLS